jgi:hypothetical protein
VRRDPKITPHHCALQGKLLSRQRPLKQWRPGTPQRIALRMTMSMRQRMPIRMARLRNMTVAISVSRRGLRQPRGITDRAEISRRNRVNVIADRLEPLQDGLPLFPIQLPQERP